MAKLLTQKQYAERKRVTPQYVNKLVREGKIELVDRKIDPRQADQALAIFKRHGRITPAKKAARKATARAAGKKSAAKRKAGTTAPRRTATDKPTSATRSLAAARSEREHWLSLTAKLDYEERQGKLLPADEVIAAEQRKNANLRTRFRRLARMVAPMCARITAAAEVEQYLLGEIDTQLEQLAADPLGMEPIAEVVEVPVEAVQTFAEIPPAVPVEEITNQEEENYVQQSMGRPTPLESSSRTHRAGA
jgi:hypothetical protein